jgi:hypothetical protein
MTVRKILPDTDIRRTYLHPHVARLRRKVRIIRLRMGRMAIHRVNQLGVISLTFTA